MFKVHEPVVYYKSSQNMGELKDNSVQLILTSPPYGKIKDYGSLEQIGFYDTFEEYFLKLKQVWTECHRVLEPKCRMVINIGDQYLRTTKFGRYRVLSISSSIINHCLDLGFDYLGDIIWQKISTTNTTGGCSLMGSIYYPRNGLITYDYEHILIFKKHQGNQKKVDIQRKELSKVPLSEWKKWYVGHWRFPGIVQKEHIAMFPEELPYRIIRMFSLIGDTVLDPFLGSGTTLKVAKSLFRKGIGYEINKNFKPIIENKIKQGRIGNFRDYQFLIYSFSQKIEDGQIKISFAKQKQKGVIIIENDKGSEIILDYLLINSRILDDGLALSRLKTKLDENPCKNYLKGKEGWNHAHLYLIIVNSQSYSETETDELINSFKTYLKNLDFTKRIEIISFEKIISTDYQISDLFNIKQV